MILDPVPLTLALIRRPSVTPVDAGAIGVLADALVALGFTTHRLTFGGPPDGPIANLFATIGAGPPHFAFAGHTDVVPAGDIVAWSADPFGGAIAGDAIVGRGAADMKGALACMVSAAAAHVARGSPGTLSFIVTGDEEGPATHGTAPLLEWMEANGHTPAMCLVGEPTSVAALGDTIKIGRRGSMNLWLTVEGTQGHVAYPARADNPITRLVTILAALKAAPLDDGTDWFQPSNLEVTQIDAVNPAGNLIPARASARVNIRFNDRWTAAALADHVGRVADGCGGARVLHKAYGEAFLTPPAALSTLVADAVRDVTGLTPALSTTGGTSDARFIRRLCPVVEFGLPGTTMHKVDERVAVADLHALARIYDRLLRQVFA